MQLDHAGSPLVMREVESPRLGPNQVRLKVLACAVCRTDLHVCDGELLHPKRPVTPGHEIVGRILEVGSAVDHLRVGTRVGVPWLGWVCGSCEFCRRGEENLCPSARFTGYQLDGGFATEALADARFVFPLPPAYSDQDAAPLMCAGLIGWRAVRAAGDGRRLGLYGFGAAAHIAAQVAQLRGQEVYGFVRPGDLPAARFARELGVVWSGDSDQMPPVALDGAIIFAPVGSLVPQALRAVRPGGTVVCGGIHMSEIPAFSYDLLWGERTVHSIANLTRRDGEEFLAFAAQHPLRISTTAYALEDANQALTDLRRGALQGAAVLLP